MHVLDLKLFYSFFHTHERSEKRKNLNFKIKTSIKWKGRQYVTIKMLWFVPFALFRTNNSEKHCLKRQIVEFNFACCCSVCSRLSMENLLIFSLLISVNFRDFMFTFAFGSVFMWRKLLFLTPQKEISHFFPAVNWFFTFLYWFHFLPHYSMEDCH